MTRRPFAMRLDVATTSTADLLAIAEFFDSDRLRAQFRSLLTEVRAELLIREKSQDADGAARAVERAMALASRALRHTMGRDGY